jgi:RHS repeat-associated protein
VIALTHRCYPENLILRTHHNSTYDAFGTLERATGGTDNQYLFAGESLDSLLSQYYLRQRYYDSEIGRFERQDSYDGILVEPFSLHNYMYANASPANYTDPSGYMTRLELVSAIVIASILWSIINPVPLEFNGLEIGSDTIFPRIDPTNGLGGQINFDPVYDFVQEALLYRLANRIPNNRNVAVVQFRDASGRLRLRAAENITEMEVGVPIHAEQMITQEILSLGVPRNSITRIYSEFEPCNFGSNNCAGFLRQNFPNARVYWSYSYNGSMELRELSRQRKYLDIEKYGLSGPYTF